MSSANITARRYFALLFFFGHFCRSLGTPTVNLNAPDSFLQNVHRASSKRLTTANGAISRGGFFAAVPKDESPSANWTRKYDAKFAELALDFASAAYAKDPTACATKNGAVIEKAAKIPCDYLDNECWVFIARTDALIVFSVRGTRTRLQLIMELVETMSAPKKKFPAGGSVQHYFYSALQNIWNEGFGIELRRLRIKYPHCRLLFTGHSLGGALSSLASSLFAYENADLAGFDSRRDVQLVTFGQPRAGNLEYARAHDALVPNSWRLIHRYDIVAHLPYCYEDWRRECTPLHNHGPYHHGTEIWYPESMHVNSSIFRICSEAPINEDQTCSNGYYIHYGISDHLFYFEKDVDFYGNAGCRADATIAPLLGPELLGVEEDDEDGAFTSGEQKTNKTKHWPRRRRKGKKHRRNS